MKLDPNDRELIIEKCEGCRRVETASIKGDDKEVCKLYLYPESKWRDGICAGVDNKEIVTDKDSKSKKRIGQQKQRTFKG